MNIKYILSFPASLIYHIFTQIDFQKEWGPASIFCLSYIELLKKHNKNLLIAEKKKSAIKNTLKNYFAAITFMCLRPQYKNYNTIIKDFSNNKFLKEQMKHYGLANLPFKNTKGTFKYLNSLLDSSKKEYLMYWNKNEKSFNEKIKYFRKQHLNIFLNYYQYLIIQL